MDAYQGILTQLNRYIRKHNSNLLIKGFLYTLGLSIALFLIVISLEYFGAFSSAIRTVLFSFSLLAFGAILIRYLILPLLQLFEIKKGLSHKAAAKLIGQHFPSVSDKLINIIELQEINEKEGAFVREIVNAGIAQKAEELKPVPILNAIDYKENLKYLKWVGVPLSIFVLGIIFFPDFITEPSKRVIAFNQEFKPKAPFEFTISARSIEVIEGEDARIQVSLSQVKANPAEVYAEFGSYREPFKKTGNQEYELVFPRVNKSFTFTVGADEFDFGRVEVIVRPSPSINSFSLSAIYPAHTKLGKQEFSSIGDIIVPQGTKLVWNLEYDNADSVNLYGITNLISKTSESSISSEWVATKNLRYGLYRKNAYVTIIDSSVYNVQVVEDEYPQISSEMRLDSLTGRSFLLNTAIADDYGFKNLYFYYKSEQTPEYQKIKLDIKEDNLRQNIRFTDNITSLGINPGSEVKYYLEVRDNDALNGYKRNRTSELSFYIKSEEELKEERNSKLDENQSALQDIKKENDQLNKSLEELRKELLNKKSSDLNDKRKLQNLLDQKQQIEKKLDKLKQESENAKELQQQIKPENEKLLEKQEQLNSLMDELMNDELKELYKELEELMSELDQEKLLEKLEQIDQNNENLNKELDRSLELLKKFALELKKEDFIGKMEKLAKEQEALSEEEIAKPQAQEELNKAFDKEKENLDKIRKEEKALDQQEPSTEELQKDAEELDKKLDENLEDIKEEKSRKNTKKDQKENAQKMKDMAAKMSSSMSSSDSAENEENIEDLKQILENLVTVSFNQESLYEVYGQISSQDPKYQDDAIKQVQYIDDFKIIEDSLSALAKRVPQIQSIIYKELSSVKNNMHNASANIAERMTSQARMNQRYALTSINNLALLLNEVLENLEKKQSQSNPGMANCSKPSSGKDGKPSLKKMREAQEKMAEKMEQMLKQGKKGSKGESKGEQSKGEGEDSNAEDLVKMAAKQAAIRKQLRDMAKELNKNGKGAGNSLNELAKEMEEIEKELFNGNINPESLLRQREILSKMLEEENAERSQETDKERKGESPKNETLSNPEWKEYLDKKNGYLERLESVPNKLDHYYKSKSEEYLNKHSND